MKAGALSVHPFYEEWPRLPFTARIDRPASI